MPTCALLSFRLGGTDGVSIVAETWCRVLTGIGFQVVTVAGEGPVDRTVADLAIGRWPDGAAGATGPDAADADDLRRLQQEVAAATADADLVVVENLGTIPMNLPAASAVADARRGRPTIWHHHDPPWQRDRYLDVPTMPSMDATQNRFWRHVALDDTTRDELRSRGLHTSTIRNAFDTDVPPGDRDGQRLVLGVGPDELLAVHPVRAIERKDVGRALSIAAELGATYWLTGPAEEGYGPRLAELFDAARANGQRLIHQPGRSLPDLYAAADLVLFPSRQEGFGNPPIEAAIHRRPAVVSHYPVADELRRLGFRWFEPEDLRSVADWLVERPPALLDHNQAMARTHCSLDSLRIALSELLDEAGWLP